MLFSVRGMIFFGGVFMEDKVVDYLQAVRDFDKAQGKQADEFDYPLRSAEEPGVVDYLKVTREFVSYLETEQPDVIHRKE